MKLKIKVFFITVLFVITAIASPIFEVTGTCIESAAAKSAKQILEVDFIDVGVGDCILISRGSHGILIDAALNEAVPKIKSVIDSRKIKKLDYLIGTHPHEDHIYGLDDIIRSYPVGKLIMPDKSVTHKCYTDVVKAAKEKNLAITNPVLGVPYNFYGAKFTFFAPNSTIYDNLNDYSIVTKLTFENTSFLFAGDAQDVSEKEMLNNGYDLKSDVLKVGHHGSGTSTTDEFLNAVRPRFAVISVEKNNDHSLPDKKILNKLANIGAKVYRTDLDGTITVQSDGSSISFNKEKAG
ncbi:MAG TPA: ComEC/Rec2 family competence protein [Ruminiclostridium sp.]|nr:ComEC/Rec2 family competence protein [Ruminiclostridium sp.]